MAIKISNTTVIDDSRNLVNTGISSVLVNSLTSTDTSKALTAAQGKVLQDTTVKLTGNQTVAGVKTFSSSPVIPTPTANNQAANKAYVDAAALQPPTAGTSFLIRRLQETAIDTFSRVYPDPGLYIGSQTTRHLGVTVLVAGTITAYLEHRRTGSTATSFARVLKNGSQVAQWSTSSTSFQTRQVNISVAVGDVIIFQQRVSVSGAQTEWRQLRIYSNNPNFAVA